MADIVVYGPPQSTYVRTARMALEEKGVAHDLEEVDFRAAEYRKLHPFGRVPAFRHGDFRLYETTAIMVYVDGTFDGPPLQPKDIRPRTRMWQWISIIGDYFVSDITRRYIMEYVFPSADGAVDRDKIEAALPHVRHHLGIADRALAANPYLAGDAPTLADLLLAPIVSYVTTFPEGGELMAANPKLNRWFEAMSRRPSFIATAPPSFASGQA